VVFALVELQNEVCDDTYSKNCHISFLEESEDVDVSVCYTEATRVCQDEDLEKRKRSPTNSEDFRVSEVCMDVYETG
jgi:hypothetical protein